MNDYGNNEEEILSQVNNIYAIVNQHTFQLDEISSSLQCYEKRKSMLLTLEEKTDDNMKRLNAMMLELKALVAMVKPQVKKTGWYGEEFPSQVLHRPDGTSEYPLLRNPDFRQSSKLNDLDINSTE